MHLYLCPPKKINWESNPGCGGESTESEPLDHQGDYKEWLWKIYDKISWSYIHAVYHLCEVQLAMLIYYKKYTLNIKCYVVYIVKHTSSDTTWYFAMSLVYHGTQWHYSGDIHD